ncbi:MAG: DUF2752 domain-containing protein [Phycisphaerales bacterium JB060]
MTRPLDQNPLPSRPDAPPTSPQPREARVLGPRLLGAIVAGVAIAPLAVGAALTPSPQGHGTHTRLGLPSCSWVVAFDAPCPTCGMTTAVTHAAGGDLIGSFLVQPAGAIFSIVAAIAFWCGLHGAISGADTVRLSARAFRKKTWWAIGGILLASWAYKMVAFESG